MNSRLRLSFILALSVLVPVLFLGAGSVAVEAQVLVGDPFITSYENWVDPLPARGGNWRINLGNSTMMETSDLIPTGNDPPAATNNGSFVPALLIQDGFTTPNAYDLSARMFTSDDDGFGVVFGYQDSDNYFRVMLRAQANGNLGGTTGLSVQKVVGGVVTQISPAGTGPGNTLAPTFEMINNRTPIDVTIAVDGDDYSVSVAGVNEGMPLASGSDADLMPGKIGVHSWAQRVLNPNPHWGTEVERISVSDNSGTLYTGTFDNMPVQWRHLFMANSLGIRTNDPPSTPAVIVGDDRGNFGLDIDDPWIYQQTNGFEWATTETPNIDFLGPAAVVDEPGSESWSDYEMRVRLGSADDDGLGVLVRVQDDDNFYRINFASQAIGAPQLPHERAPQGLSVQKVQDGVWSELFRDDQDNPLFIFDPSGANADTPATGLPMFDLVVRAVGNQLGIQVIDGSGNVINYPLITDSDNPLLSGTVGFQTWGSEHDYFMSFGGQSGPLLTVIPEPATVALAAIACLGVAGLLRRRRT